MSDVGRHAADASKAAATLLLLVGLVVAAGVWVFFQLFLVDGCGGRCLFDLLNVARNVQLWGGIGVIVASAIGVVLAVRAKRESWWIPLVGSALVVAVTILDTLLIHIATAR